METYDVIRITNLNSEVSTITVCSCVTLSLAHYTAYALNKAYQTPITVFKVDPTLLEEQVPF